MRTLLLISIGFAAGVAVYLTALVVHGLARIG